MRSLITGGSGYFGSLLLCKLLSKGESCCILDLLDADDRPREVEFFQADIRDFDAVLKACQGIDVIYHNVAQVPLAKDKALFNSVNILGTDNLLKAAMINGVSKVVYTSSSAVFGIPPSNPVTDSILPNPGEAYGKAKLEGEKLCHQYVEQGLDVSIIRPRTIMGHGRLGIFQILFEWIRQGYNVPVLGEGNNCYQFIHADDLAEACMLAAARPEPAIYNCGTNRFGSMREVLEHLCNYAGTHAQVKSVPMLPAILGMKATSRLGISPLGAYHSLMYGRSMYFDISKAQSELGWQPRYSNNEMFVQSYDWYLQNKDLVFSNQGTSYHRSPVKQGVLSIVKWFL